ncbi:IS30 family transposase [Geodermatophilus sp. URMC 63]
MGVTGAVPLPMELRRRFWRLIVAGSSTEAATAAVDIDRRTGMRWFIEAGGMPPMTVAEPTGRSLSLGEREEISLHRAAGLGVREIARRLGRSPSTISRELARGCLNRRPRGRYRASLAQARADARARRPKPAKLVVHPRLRDWVADKLERLQWSPEQIARRLRVEFSDDESMRISHEAIYQSIYVQGRGALRRKLAVCLRTGRALRKPHRRADGRRERIKNKLMISQRPPEVEDRAVPGHWEGDLVIGKNGKTAVGTLVERSTRFLLLLHLPDGFDAEAVRDAITDKITTLPAVLRRSLTWDQGLEMRRHAEITIAADLPVYFCDPHSPWQRGSNENTNGLLRQYLPKSTDLSQHTANDLDTIADKLNGQPRKTLEFRTPAESSTGYSAPINQPVLRRPAESTNPGCDQQQRRSGHQS